MVFEKKTFSFFQPRSGNDISWLSVSWTVLIREERGRIKLLWFFCGFWNVASTGPFPLWPSKWAQSGKKTTRVVNVAMISVLLILVAINHGGQGAKRQRCQKRSLCVSFYCVWCEAALKYGAEGRFFDCLNGHRDCRWVLDDIHSKTCDLWERGAVPTSLKDYPRTESLH